MTSISDGVTWSARTVAERDAEEDVTGPGDFSDTDNDDDDDGDENDFDAAPDCLEAAGEDRQDGLLVSSHGMRMSGDVRERAWLELTDEDDIRGRMVVSVASSRDEVTEIDPLPSLSSNPAPL